MGRIRFGFLGGRGSPQPRALQLICGASKRKNQLSQEGNQKRRKLASNPRPVIDMLLHLGAEQYRVKALLDTGCSIALINEKTVEKLGITRRKHNQAYSIEGFTAESVEGAGQYYTDPTLLQHRNHYSREKFEISRMEAGIDIFLPFKWITAHPPQGAWDTDEVRFNSANCLKNCTKSELAEFSLSWDESVALDPSARTIGYVAAVSHEPTDNVPMAFRQYLGIMSKEAADALPEHRPYDCKIDLREGTTAPWGPIYPLSEVELQTL